MEQDQEAAGKGHRVVSFDREPMQTKSKSKEEPDPADEDSDFEPLQPLTDTTEKYQFVLTLSTQMKRKKIENKG